MIKNTLILYTYCENQKGILANKDSSINLKYFLDNGLIENTKYLFCININGSYKFNFNNYLKKYSNLKIFEGNGKCQLDGWFNIIKNIKKKYDYYYFITDKVAGPFNRDYFNENWIEYINSKINNNIIISSYGTSPHGKLYKIPYYTMKFFCTDKNIFDFLIKNDIFTNLRYDTTINNEHNIDNIKEIKLSYILLENNINYIALDKNKIIDLNLISYYKTKNWNKLFEITKKLHKINDLNMKDRIFWTGKIMIKIFSNNKFSQKFLIKRDVSKLDRW